MGEIFPYKFKSQQIKNPFIKQLTKRSITNAPILHLSSIFLHINFEIDTNNTHSVTDMESAIKIFIIKFTISS